MLNNGSEYNGLMVAAHVSDVLNPLYILLFKVFRLSLHLKFIRIKSKLQRITDLENPGSINFEDSFALPFIRIGKGKKSAIAFHGFGQDSTYYTCLEPLLGKEYTIYSFDLPFHGNFEFTKTIKPINKESIRSFFSDFLEINRITEFLLIGFSIGAKLSLVLLDLFPEKIEKMMLIAPDGFRTNIWFKLATGTRPARSIFKYIVYNPDYFFKLSDAMVSFRLVNRCVTRFAHSQMSSLQKREKVYYAWMFFRKLRFSNKRIMDALIKNKIPLSVFLGNEDNIIWKSQFKLFSENTYINIKITTLSSGHNNLIEETAKFLQNIS
jgi:pimeloyl-ACP methyl ester carboxylesterase